MRTHNYSCSRLFLPHLRDGLKCAGRGSFNLYTLYCLLKTVFDIANLIRERECFTTTTHGLEDFHIHTRSILVQLSKVEEPQNRYVNS